MADGCKQKLPEACAFFEGCKIHILPSALGHKRHALLEMQITKYGGQVASDLNDHAVSHIIVAESILSDPETCLAILKKAGRDLDGESETKVLGTCWLTSCLKEKQLIDTETYELITSKATVKRKKSHSESSEDEHSSFPSTDAHPVESPPTKKPNVRSEKFACSQASGNSSSEKQHNHIITDELQKLADAFRSSGDRWRSYGYDKAISAIKAYPKEITSYKDIESLPGIGQKMAAKVIEILESGKLQKVEEICGQDRVKVVELFNKVWGVGPATADAWYVQGCRTLEDLQNKIVLTKQQSIGLKHFDEFQTRIPREEVEKIGDMVMDTARAIDKNVTCVLGGSFRRGKPTCGDIDVLICRNNDSTKFLSLLIAHLKDEGLITDDLVDIEASEKQKKYLGVCRLPGETLHRRLDIFVVLRSEFATALMHYTGSALFNRSIRLLAASKGMSLSEHNLVAGIVRQGKEILNDGHVIPTPTEESIFEALGLDYRSPEERDH